MDALTLALNGERSAKEQLQQDKASLEAAVQAGAVKEATLKGEVARAEQNTEVAKQEVERYELPPFPSEIGEHTLFSRQQPL